MSLQQLYEQTPPQQRALQFGIAGGDALTGAFPQKRVVHAGLQGSLVSPEESQKIWQDLMAQPPTGKEIQTAYIHIPFCKTKCLYCGFFQNGMDQSVEDEYVRCLVQELRQAARTPRLRDSLIHAVFIGGGTPTSLSKDNAARLLGAIRDCLPLANDYELTLEGRVHDLEADKMDTWLAYGVNRMSLGVQSFNTKVRQSVGRLDDRDTVLERLEALRAYGQCVVVIDLMYGLPGQTMDVWMDDVRTFAESGIDGADLYQLNVFEGSALNRAIGQGTLPPAATTAQQALMFQAAKTYLDQRAYTRLNICHWSKSRRERSLYNTLARSGAAMFPFGSGAGGHVDGYETMLHRAIAPYEMFVHEGKKPFMALLRQSPFQPLIDDIQYQLEQCYLDIGALAAREPRLGELNWLYQRWQEQGLVRYNGVLYELTDAGQFWQVNLTQTTLECMQYLLTGQTAAALQGIAAQDSPKSAAMAEAMRKMKESGAGPSLEAMRHMAEAMKHMSREELQAVMQRMKG